jgi:hypothetical protein
VAYMVVVRLCWLGWSVPEVPLREELRRCPGRIFPAGGVRNNSV